MIKILHSGFHPIWGIKNSPSGEIVKIWASGSISVEGVEAHSVILPQIFGKDSEILCGEILKHRPHIVVMWGASQHSIPVKVERFGLNVENTPMGDNTKIPVRDRKISLNGPPAIESTIPVRHLVDGLKSGGIESIISYSAGTHCCNSVLYSVLLWIEQNRELFTHPVKAGFVHVPFPNAMGVMEDTFWSTATFEGIVKASIEVTKILAAWYAQECSGVL